MKHKARRFLLLLISFAIWVLSMVEKGLTYVEKNCRLLALKCFKASIYFMRIGGR